MASRNLRQFGRNIRGSTLIIFTLALPVLLLMVAGAIDFGRAVQLRVELQDAVDAASVGLVDVGSPAYKAAIAMTSDGTVTNTITQAQAQKMFTADFSSSSAVSALSLTATVTKSGMAVNSSVIASAKYNTLMLGLLSPSFSQIPLSIRATSTSSIPPYIDFYLLLDNTPSMGLAATSAGMTWMQTHTPSSVSAGVAEANCSFACHEMDLPTSKKKGIDYYTLARNNQITLRIDVVRQATQQLMTTAQSTETLSNQYRMAIYDFGVNASQVTGGNPPANPVTALSPDLAATAKNAAAVDLMIVPSQSYNNDEDTNLQSVLSDMNSRIPAPGNGGTANTPQKVLFFVTDGLNDGYDCNYSDGGNCRRIRPLDPAVCQTMKSRGVQIAILYTTYIPPQNNGFTQQYVTPLISPTDKVQAALQTCASSGLFYAVAPDQDLSAAMNALFKKVVAVQRITS